MKKWIIRIVLAVVVIVIIGLVVLYFSLNSLVKWGVERGGTQATNQNTTLQTADLSLGSGTVDLSGLQIANVKGYPSPQLLTLKDCKVAVESGSLLSSDVKVDSITLEGLVLNVDQNGVGTNLTDILAAAKSQTAAGGGTEAPGKQLTIGVIKLTGTQVNVNLLGRKITLNLGPIEMKDPTNPDGRPMKIADVVAKVLINVAQQIAANPQVPELKDALKSLSQFKGDLANIIPGNAKGLPGNLQKGLQGLGNNLFNKNKDQQNK